MYQKDQYVMHKSEGVCLVEDIRTECFSKEASREYYILRPVYGNAATTVFLPVDGSALRSRPLLTKEELERALSPRADETLVLENNDRLRQETLRQLLRQADPYALYLAMRELFHRREDQQPTGKRLRFFEEQFLQDAKRLLTQEVAHVFSVDTETAQQYVQQATEQ